MTMKSSLRQLTIIYHSTKLHDERIINDYDYK